MSIFNYVLNKKGVTLVEVMVSAAMTAIVSLGVATMMQNSFKEQRRVVLLDTLKNQKTKFESMIRDQAIWNATMNSTTHNAGGIFAQMRSASPVSEVSYTTPVEYKLVYSDNTLAFDLLGPDDNSGSFAGLTEKGQNCSTFDPSTGVDECPISYRLMIGADCPGTATTCVNPQLKLVARLVFNPSSAGTLNSYRSFVAAVAGKDINDTVQDSKYDAVVKRTSTSVNRSFRIINRFSISSGGCAAAGGGTCTNAFGTHPRTLTDGWVADYDPHSLVSVTSSANFYFREMGYYGCVISAPAFATDLFTLGLVNYTINPTGTSPIGSAQVTAGKWSQATSVIDVKFSVNQPTNAFRIFQSCGVSLTTIPAADRACTLGVYTDYYSTPTVISMSCYKIDRAM